MKHTAGRNLGLGVSALLMLGLTSIATPAYANGFQINATAASITTGQSVQFSTDAPADRAFSVTVDGVLNGYGVVSSFTQLLPWSFFGGCEDVIVTYAVFDSVFVDGVAPAVELSDFVSVTFVGGGEDCGPADPQTMTLTGDPQLGSTVTATATVPGSLGGGDFDLWVCPDTTVRPTDNNDDEANGACIGPFIQEQDGDSTSFLLGFDPVRDELDEEFARAFWQAACGKYFIVHDFPDGGHSNWIGPVICPSAAPQLADTGAAPIAGLGGLAAVLALLVGGGLLVAARRRNALSAE